MPYKDLELKKQKHKEYSKRYYEANKEKIIANNKVRKRVRRSDWQVFKATLSCVNCGENHPATFDFHHIERHPDNRKVYKLLQSNNIGGALEEIKKCVILCANCHRKGHDWEKNGYTENMHKMPELEKYFIVSERQKAKKRKGVGLP
jgi:5-methylcytosine-specific restriction endonuclease McrA